MSPIVYDTVPNFGKEALPRRYAFVVDEAGGTADMAPCPGGVRTGSYMLDITNETRPFPVSVWQVPVGNFCTKGGRFGPHQSADTVNGKINRFENKIAWLAYFNAGIRVLDPVGSVSDERVGLLHPEDQRALAPDRDGPADGRSRSTTSTSTRAGSLTRRIELELDCLFWSTPDRLRSNNRVDAPRVLSPGLPTRGHPIARSPRDGGPGVLGAKSTCDEMAPARRAGRPHPAPPAPKHFVNSAVRVHVCWLATACASPTSSRSRNAGGAIHRVDFRHRVLVASNQHWRFEPRSGCCHESASSRRGIGRVRAQAAFPAAASAAANQYT